MNFKRTPFWLWPVVIGAVGGLIASAIFWLYFLIPASVTKAKRQAFEQKQKLPEPAKEDKQTPRQQSTQPQTKVVPNQDSVSQASIDAAQTGGTILIQTGVYREALKFKEWKIKRHETIQASDPFSSSNPADRVFFHQRRNGVRDW